MIGHILKHGEHYEVELVGYFGSTDYVSVVVELEQPFVPWRYDVDDMAQTPWSFNFVLSHSANCAPFLQQQAAQDRDLYLVGASGKIHFYDNDAHKWATLNGQNRKFFISQDELHGASGPTEVSLLARMAGG